MFIDSLGQKGGRLITCDSKQMYFFQETDKFSENLGKSLINRMARLHASWNNWHWCLHRRDPSLAKFCNLFCERGWWIFGKHFIYSCGGIILTIAANPLNISHIYHKFNFTCIVTKNSIFPANFNICLSN